MSDINAPKTKGGWQNFVAGSFAGMAQVAVGQPLDTIKVRLQLERTRFKGPTDCFMQTVRKEGFLALYKGMASPLVGIGAVNALLFASYTRFKAIQTPHRDGLSLGQIAIAGSGAGLVNSVLASPVELLKIRMQAQYSANTYPGPVDVAQQLIREHGIRNGLFRGFWATVLREIPAYAGFYSAFEFGKRRLTPIGGNPDALPPTRIMAAGALGGIAYWLCCYPLDVIKSKVQNQQQPPKGFFYVLTTIRTVYRQEGLRAFSRGISPTLLRSIPAAGATFTVYELTMRMFENFHVETLG